MLEKTFQRQESAEPVKCIKCGRKNATKEDKMCDSCRYLLALENIVKDRK